MLKVIIYQTYFSLFYPQVILGLSTRLCKFNINLILNQHYVHNVLKCLIYRTNCPQQLVNSVVNDWNNETSK